jgi:hypothetical protein
MQKKAYYLINVRDGQLEAVLTELRKLGKFTHAERAYYGPFDIVAEAIGTLNTLEYLFILIKHINGVKYSQIQIIER